MPLSMISDLEQIQSCVNDADDNELRTKHLNWNGATQDNECKIGVLN